MADYRKNGFFKLITFVSACLVVALSAGCQNEAPVNSSETISAASLGNETDNSIDFDLTKKSHVFKGFGAQIWAYGADGNYPNLLKYRQKVLRELNIKYVRIENFKEEASWEDMADTRAMTDELGIKWVYMIWTGPNQYEDSKRLLTDVTGFATWWKDHVAELYKHNIPVEYIELMNEPDSGGEWSTGINGVQFNELVKDLCKKLDDAGFGNVGIVGAGPANMWTFPNYAKALDEKGVEALAVFSTHAWGTDGAWMGHQGLGPGQYTYQTTIDNFLKPCNKKSPDKPKFVTEYSTHQTKYDDVTYPHGDKYGQWDPNKVFPYNSVIDSMRYAVRTFTNTLALLNAGSEAAFIWQGNDEPTEVNPPGYNNAGKRKAWGLIDLWGREKPVYGALKTIYPNIPVGAEVLIAPDQSAKTLYAGAFVTDDKVIIGVSNESSTETTSVINLSNAGSLKFNQALAFKASFRGDPAKGEPDRGKEIKKQLILNPKGPGKYAIGISLPPLSTLTIILDKGNRRNLAEIVSHQAPDIHESKDFRIWVNGSEMFTGQAGNRSWNYSFCAFDFSEPVTIRVKSVRAIKWLEILPSVLKIEHNTKDDYTFEFTLHEPKKITILVNNDRNNALHILTSLPEKNRPNPNDKNVLFYKAGKTYDVGVLDLKDNQTLYIESGAKLKGMIRVKDADNVKILGRGMIDGTDNKSGRNHPANDEPWRLIYLDHSENVKIEGITLFNSPKWTIHPYACKNLDIDNINIINWNYGSDGIDISSCQNVKVINSFLRTNDDCVVIKSLSLADKMYYPNPRIQNPDVKDILVQGCTVWNMAYGNAFDIGFELRCDKVSDIIFRDCDVLMQEGRGAVLSIHNGDNAMVENVLFDNIRVENADQAYSHKLFDVAILFSMWSYDKFNDDEMISKYRYHDAWDNLLPVLSGKEEFHASHRGHVRNIHFRNIQVLDGKLPYSVINGYDEDHIVENVTFENISVQDRKITNEKDLKLFSKYAENVQFK